MRAAPADPDVDLIAHAVGELTARTRFPVAFGGMLQADGVHISAVAGARTHHLDALVVERGRGLGGRAVLETRPRLALDYRTAKGITHDYDGMVLGEGIATLFAVPIVVSGTPRGVLYCGSWGQAPVGEFAARPAFAIAEDVVTELRIRDEVARRLTRIAAPERQQTVSAATREELRDAYAQLRQIAASVQDDALRQRLTLVEQRLAALSIHDSPVELEITLSPRETDVLACAAVGSTNAQIGVALGLKEATVKSYLAAAMSKLDASTRHSAVAKARRAGILP
ncbi:LuxR C-terminal-related transcriptional regulator [Microbacterium terrisoli]|uniref:LuxR C-terminal-related transcriptional regulator n=1 Tax=Microbacterium terrisoli TaxID=3242192 RepID=UPI00280568B1|nr:LuxR C-terminal-related transcriptional regulator [Microbacterium protaetiae]